MRKVKLHLAPILLLLDRGRRPPSWNMPRGPLIILKYREYFYPKRLASSPRLPPVFPLIKSASRFLSSSYRSRFLTEGGPLSTRNELAPAERMANGLVYFPPRTICLLSPSKKERRKLREKITRPAGRMSAHLVLLLADRCRRGAPPFAPRVLLVGAHLLKNRLITRKRTGPLGRNGIAYRVF